MSTVSQVVIDIVGRADSLNRTIEQAFGDLERIKRKAETMKVHFEPTRDIWRQMETWAAIEEKLYQATHTQQEIALRDSTEYFNTLKTEWVNNEQMMTMITRLETATRTQIMEQYANSSVAGLLKIRSEYMKVARVGIIAKLGLDVVGNLAQSITDFKTKGFGEGYESLVRSIPLLGNAIAGAGDKLGNMLAALTGITEELEKQKILFDSAKNLQGITEDYIKRKEYLEAATSQERELLSLRYKHEEQLSKLDDEKRRLQVFTAENDKIRERIKLLEKARDAAPAGRGLPSIADAPGFLGKDDYSAMIDDLKQKLYVLPNIQALINQETKIYNTEIEAIKNKPFLDITASLQEQLDTLGKTESEITVYRASLQGLTENQLASVRVMAEELEARKEEIEAQKNAKREAENYTKTAQALIEKYNPLIALEREQADLSNLLSKGYIDQATYLAAVAEATEKYENALTSKEKAVREMFDTLEFERSLLGKTNEERDRAIDMLRMQKAAEEAYGVGTEKTIETMRKYHEELIKLGQEKRQAESSWSNYMNDLAYDMENFGEYAGSVMVGVANDIKGNFSDAFYDIMMTGKTSFEALGESIHSSLARGFSDMLAQRMMAAIMLPGSQEGGMLGLGNLFATTKHTGGLAGMGDVGRFVPAAAYLNAPRYHNGFMPNEVPAILKKGEGVFTPEQMAALGRSGDSVNMNVTVQAIDTQSGMQFIGQQSRTIANQVYRQMRRNHQIRRGGR